MIKAGMALKIILDTVRSIGSEYVPLTDALSRVLAEDIYADEDIPGFDNSAMDGYAVRFADVKGASRKKPRMLEVIADLKAGDVLTRQLKCAESVRIMTGAPLPQGAQSVIMVEDTKRQGRDAVEIFKEAEPGENVRRKGEDIKKGELVLPKGTLLDCAHIGLLAGLGKSRIKAARKPRVAILATGDELVDAGDRVTKGKIRSSNTYTLFSQVIKCGGLPKNLGIAKDSPLELKKKINQGRECDIILTSGGVSVGDYDLVKDVLAEIGTDIKFRQVAVRPGKPLVFGTLSARHGAASGGKDILVFGLPGNPVSSMVSFEIFVRPALLKMSGRRYNSGEKEVEAAAEEDIRKKPGLRYFLRACTSWKHGAYYTRTTGPQGSAILRSMAAANSFIILPEEEEKIKKGAKVTVRFLN